MKKTKLKEDTLTVREVSDGGLEFGRTCVLGDSTAFAWVAIPDFLIRNTRRMSAVAVHVYGNLSMPDGIEDKAEQLDVIERALLIRRDFLDAQHE